MNYNSAIESWLSQPRHEITQGFPIKQATELAAVYRELLRKEVTRMPIFESETIEVAQVVS